MVTFPAANVLPKDPNIDGERKVFHKEISRIRKFYKDTTDEEELYIRFLAAHNKGLDLLLTGARRRIQAHLYGMRIEEAMQREMMHSVGTPLGMLHVMVWYAMATTADDHELRRMYVWAYIRHYNMVRVGLGVLAPFSLNLSHQPLERSERQWDKAIQFFTWCEFEAHNFEIRDDLDIRMLMEDQSHPLAARLRGIRIPKLKKVGGVLKKRAHHH
ncbi:hypothetical protein AYL99_09779 [Fonsecaea erecta]|uniref:Uncharacterized protein n=1 Tax=Fonsecaea erecta TaxID=1367422 RepID=A0A178Z792_9EURO|nr:hypothetical protein AYL99_09779 [Fonsecaea erecta]OAP55627.1 hypothetical protein AYL99_09779 [Fonsecaea erecta]